MTLSYRAQKILEENISWPRINIAYLHDNDIETIVKCFKYLIDNDMSYKINEIDAWSNTYFLGLHEQTRQYILMMAKVVKHRFLKPNKKLHRYSQCLGSNL